MGRRLFRFKERGLGMYNIIKDLLEVCGHTFKMRPVSKIVHFSLAIFSCIVAVWVRQRIRFK